MELVRKKDKRGQLVRKLTLSEKVALLHDSALAISHLW